MSGVGSTRHMRGWWRLFPASRIDRSTILALAAAGLATLMLTPQTYHQPFSEWDEAVAAAPLTPGILALLLGFGTTNVMATLERGHGGRLRIARLIWSSTLAGAVAAVTLIAAPLADAQWHVPMLRNILGLTGLALLSAVVLGARQAWAPVFFPIAATLLVGRDPYTAAPRDWALLLAPADSVIASVVAGGLLTAGIVSYTCRDSRPTHGLPEEE
jgi:hypothetical protein